MPLRTRAQAQRGVGAPVFPTRHGRCTDHHPLLPARPFCPLHEIISKRPSKIICSRSAGPRESSTPRPPRADPVRRSHKITPFHTEVTGETPMRTRLIGSSGGTTFSASGHGRPPRSGDRRRAQPQRQRRAVRGAATDAGPQPQRQRRAVRGAATDAGLKSPSEPSANRATQAALGACPRPPPKLKVNRTARSSDTRDPWPPPLPSARLRNHDAVHADTDPRPPIALPGRAMHVDPLSPLRLSCRSRCADGQCTLTHGSATAQCTAAPEPATTTRPAFRRKPGSPLPR
jgi:hypothetical protein